MPFNDLKLMLTNVPVLQRPDNFLQYILHTDWSPVAIGAVLAQIGPDGKEHHIAYGSRMLRLNYAPTQGECFSVDHWLKHYLYGFPFILEVDHWTLKWLMSTVRSEMLARWAMRLQDFNMEIRCRPGYKRTNADAMSRPPMADEPQSTVLMAFRPPQSLLIAGEGSPDSVRVTDDSAAEEEERDDVGLPVSPNLTCGVDLKYCVRDDGSACQPLLLIHHSRICTFY